jgi:protein phosphatase
VNLSAFGLSDVGHCRETNEDNYFFDSTLGVYTVADGMGGHAAGEVASRLAVEAFEETFRVNGGLGESIVEATERLRTAVTEANRRICDSILAHAEQRGMGTTVVTLLTIGDRAVVGHVGDSRAYLLRGERLERLTDDHSWVSEQVRAGMLTDDDAQRHPMRNIVTRALGSRTEVAADIADTEILPGDVFLLCSDGLNAMLSDREIGQKLAEHRRDPEAACRALVDAANARGGEDNTTVIVLSAGNGPAR